MLGMPQSPYLFMHACRAGSPATHHAKMALFHTSSVPLHVMLVDSLRLTQDYFCRPAGTGHSLLPNSRYQGTGLMLSILSHGFHQPIHSLHIHVALMFIL